MICHEVKERLQAFADGASPPVESREIEEHLASCASCRKEADLLSENLSFLGNRLSRLEGTVRPDLAFLDSMAKPPAAATEPTVAKPRGERTRPRVPVLLPIAGIAAVLIAAGWLALRGRDGEETAPALTEARGPPTAPRSAPDRPPRPAPDGDTRPKPPPPKEEPDRPPPLVRPRPVRPGAVQSLPLFLRTPSTALLRQMWASLAEKPGDADGLLSALENTDSHRNRALITLALAGATGREQVARRLATLLSSDGSPEVRRAAAAALARSEEEGASSISVLSGLTVPVGALTDESRRAHLLSAAESERDPDTLGVLIRLLGPSQSLDGSITDRLVELAENEDPAIRDAAIDAIRLGRPKDPEAVLRMVFDRELPVGLRARLVPAAAGSDPARVRSNLRRIYDRAEDDEVRVAALRGLAEDPEDDTIALASGLVRGAESPEIRRAALGIVLVRRTKETRALLQEVAERDPDPALRAAAAEAERMLAKEIESRD